MTPWRPLATGAVGEPHTPLARLRSRPYADLVKILYLAITGASDPTRASIPLHIAANGSVVAGQECAVVLAGDATELVLRGTAERVEGVGVPPVKELFQKLLDHQVPVYV
jgi:predicted peroxiredoxin